MNTRLEEDIYLYIFCVGMKVDLALVDQVLEYPD